MLKIFAVFSIAGLLSAVTGCVLLGETPEERHALAVQKVTDYAEAVVCREIDLSKNLTKTGKAKAKADVAKIKAEILAKIEELRNVVNQHAEAGEAAGVSARDSPE